MFSHHKIHKINKSAVWWFSVSKHIFFFYLDSGYLTAFQGFLRSEFSDENIEFWLECEDFKSASAGDLPLKAERIYQRFIQPAACREVSSWRASEDKTPPSLVAVDGHKATLTTHYHVLFLQVQFCYTWVDIGIFLFVCFCNVSVTTGGSSKWNYILNFQSNYNCYQSKHV